MSCGGLCVWLLVFLIDVGVCWYFLFGRCVLWLLIFC